MDTKKVAITLLVITIALSAVSLVADLGDSSNKVSQGNSNSGSQADVAFTVEAPNDSGNNSPSQPAGGGQ